MPVDSSPLFDTLAICGVGLLGGSLARACRARGIVRRTVGIGRDPARLVAACRAGVIDEAVQSPEELRGVDLLVVCTPVDRIVDDVARWLPHLPDGATITDVGSTKASICAGIDDLPQIARRFIGSHPLAGSDLQGWEHSSPDLFVDRLCVLTPTAATDPARLAKLAQFWTAVGMRTLELSPADHDRHLARTSHLPHAVAAALALALRAGDEPFVASGFRDTTRIAGGDAGLWTPIFLQNAAAVLEAIDEFRQQLDDLQEAIEDGDTEFLNQLLEQARSRRVGLAKDRRTVQ
jgi:prephenate dehydrogenase